MTGAPIVSHSADRETLVSAWIAIGANLDDPKAHVLRAFDELARLPQTRLIARSSLYRSAPVGYDAQPDFFNAAVEIETAMSPRALLDALVAIERTHGRVRTFQNAPRTLDLDIALYGDQIVRDERLTIPHPRMLERAFVLVPLAEIAPQALVPGQGRVRDLVERVQGQAIERVKE